MERSRGRKEKLVPDSTIKLAEFTSEAVRSVFEAYGLDLTEHPEGSETAEGTVLMSVIGFAGETLRGSLVMVASEELFAASRTSDEHDVRDWAGELANQVLGRVKNQLVLWGTDVNMSTPLVVRGLGLSVEGQEMVRMGFSGGRGTVSVCLDAEAAPGWELVEPSEDDALPAEGEALLF